MFSATPEAAQFGCIPGFCSKMTPPRASLYTQGRSPKWNDLLTFLP